MSKGEMSRLRIAATAAVAELSNKVAAAEGAAREALKAEERKAIALEDAAREKERAEVLNPTEAGAGAKLTSAADALEAEVARLKQSTAHLQQLSTALKAGKDAVGLFQAVAG